MIIILIIIALPIIFRKTIASFILNKVEFFLKRTKLTQKAINTFTQQAITPLSLLGILFSFSIVTEYLSLSEKYSFMVIAIQKSLTIVIVFWLIHASIDLFSFKIKRFLSVLSKEMVDWFLKALKVFIVFLTIASVLELWGIKVAPILAGLGLFGVAIALGAQDLFKNLIAGILIIAEKRFEKGEWIKVDGTVEGTVEDIGFRSTKVIRFDKAPVFVPNSELSDNVVTNFSRMSHRRINFKIGVLYSTTTEQLRQITENINKYIQENDDFAKENITTFVKIESFSDSSIDIVVYCFTETTVWTDWLSIRESLICEIKTIVANAGTDFAYPSTSLYLGEDEKEIFQSFTGKTKK
ncbi:MAG: mechanosensitive ion channel family protein [Proteobacteria bacterium]|nr:mechanosensitive ion channel family protein [Pseudomonadota bacterium]